MGPLRKYGLTYSSVPGLHAPCSDDTDCSPYIPDSVCTEGTCQCDAANNFVELPDGGDPAGGSIEARRKRAVEIWANRLGRIRRGEIASNVGTCVKGELIHKLFLIKNAELTVIRSVTFKTSLLRIT